jgi:hypothetical protein
MRAPFAPAAGLRIYETFEGVLVIFGAAKKATRFPSV